MSYIAKDTRYGAMRYNRCGASGLKLPAVSLGLWHNFGTRDDFSNMKQMCFTAFDNGVTHFDLANNYGPDPGSAEENFGRIINGELKAYRDEIVVSTKAGYKMWEGPYGDFGSRKYLTASLDQSLRRMGLDYVDIFYHHRPDPDTPLEESLSALDSIVRSGKALYVGLSKYDSELTERAIGIMKRLNCPFIINQSSYSMLNRAIEADGLKNCAVKNGFGIIAFSPLAQGQLSGRYLNGIPEDSRAKKSGVFLKPSDLTDERMARLRALNEAAALRGQSLAQTALAWVLRDGAVTSVLIGASRPEQITENITAVGNTAFTSEELDKIDAITAR